MGPSDNAVRNARKPRLVIRMRPPRRTIDARAGRHHRRQRPGNDPSGKKAAAFLSTRPCLSGLQKRDESGIVNELSEDSPGAVVPEKDQSETAEPVRCLQRFNISYIDEEKGGSRAT